jgi:hypothetical protein
VLGFVGLSEDHACAEVEPRLQAFLGIVPLDFIDYADAGGSFSQHGSGKHLGCAVQIKIVLNNLLNNPWRCASL